MQNKSITRIVSIVLIFIGSYGYFHTISEIRNFKDRYDSKLNIEGKIQAIESLNYIDDPTLITSILSIEYDFDSKKFTGKIINSRNESTKFIKGQTMSLLLKPANPHQIEINHNQIQTKDSFLYDKLIGIFLIFLSSIGVILFFLSFQSRN